MAELPVRAPLGSSTSPSSLAAGYNPQMYANFKILVLVMVVAAIVFALGKPVATRFMTAEDFARRRNLWLFLCAASFIAPSMWLYVLVAAPVIFVVGKRDSNPVAVYLFVLLAVPPLRVEIPTLGLIGQLFPMDHLRLLSLALLLPIAFRVSNYKVPYGSIESQATKQWITVDRVLLAYLALQLLLILPYGSFTSVARRVVLLVIDVGLPYFVVSRACRSREMIAEAMASFVVAAAVLVPLEVFEFFRGNMLFAGIGVQWEAGDMYFPLHRGPFLRAQTTAGHSIFMGYFMAMAIGMWLYLKAWVTSSALRWLGTLTLLAGLVVPLARGPWLGAIAVFFAYTALGPDAVKRSLKGSAVVAALIMVVAVSPWRSELVDYLPFVGTVDAHTVDFRERLATASWTLIQQNPFFGSFRYLGSLEEFRTGEGIIDLVNTYAIVALTYGLVGLTLFLAVFMVSIWKAFRVARLLKVQDPAASLMGTALIACIIGTLLVLATTSFLHAMPYFTWTLLGLTFAYVRCVAGDMLRPVHSQVHEVRAHAI